MIAPKASTAFFRSAVLLVLPTVLAVSDAPTGEFWYPEGRAEYAGSAAATVVSAVMSVVPQISGVPVFDSGTGDQAQAVLASGFSSYRHGLCLSIR